MRAMPYGACASGDPHSALAGRNALMEGGNAVDAAVAAGLMAAFSLQTMTGLGGGGLMTLRMGEEVQVLDFFSNLPGRGWKGPRPQPEAIQVPFEDVLESFHIGAPTVAVPGVVAGLWEVHRRYGRLPMKELALLTVEAARGGVEMTTAQNRSFTLLQGICRRTPEAWALVGDEDGVLQVGQTLQNPDLATTLEHLVEEGPRAFYEGEIGERVTEATAGLVTAEDLAGYQPVWRPPLDSTYRDATLYMPGVPCLSGGMLFVALNELDMGPTLPRRLAPKDWGRIARALECGEALRTVEYEERVFDQGWLEGLVAASKSGNTLHCSTIDADGNTVAYTSSMGEGSAIVARGTGIALNNFLGEPDIVPREGANVAGRRMMTSMCPTLVRRGDGRWMSLGSAGSDRIRSAILQVLVRVIDGGRRLQEAIGRPRIHTRDGTLFIEGYGRTPEQVEALKPFGKEIVTTWSPGFFFGGVQAVAQTADGGFDVGADSVRRGCAGYLA
jgi:gamma-glutamyltranspeptidase/glutathione hydrolase